MSGIDFTDDKMHEECGVFGIYSHSDDVALNTYWGLYALQHRGQESCGIATTDGSHMEVRKGMGLVADVFKGGVSGLEGHIAIGHVRYSTTGSSMAYNIQPLRVYFDGGNLALAHNGNLTNAAELRKRLSLEGAVFQTTVDTEVVVSLIARSRKKTIEERVAEAANTIKGAFGILVMTDNKLIAVRDPYGFRPLAIGKMDGGWVVASESCAFERCLPNVRTAYLNMFILRVPTALSTSSRFIRRVLIWAASWPKKPKTLKPISSFPYRTAVRRRQLATALNPACRLWKV